MMNPTLKKLHFKGQSPVLLLKAPPELKDLREAFEVPVHVAPKGEYGFVLAFAESQSAATAQAKAIKKLLSDERSLFWLAYPKSSSKKYDADLNRDSLHALMEKLGFDGVSLVALDKDWSAMRFKLAQA
ncbi:MAG TPA: hypothetical protein VHW01_16775 [Polyangiaceae bacterium]|jgi:hypothetical protein|nr:hypothetical protein [Polyangiaceae bacterium]